MIKYFFILLTLFVYFSCTQDQGDMDGSKSISEEEEVIDADSLSIDDDTKDAEDIKEDDRDADIKESEAQIEAKYGVQWDFCTCVIKNDSVNQAMMDDGISDEDLDLLFERSEIIDNKCKNLLIQPNATPEQREKHLKKVNACLRNK